MRHCYKNIHCWCGPYSFSFSSLPSTSILRTTHAYTCTISFGWSYFHPTFSGCIPFNWFPTHLYHICLPDLWLAPLCPFHFTSVETQVFMGMYRPYCTTLYWHLLQCSHLHNFHIFTYLVHFALSHFCSFCVFAFSCMLHISCSLRSRIFFCTLTCTTVRLPRVHRIPFAYPVLILQGPLVCILLCFTHIISYMSLHFHVCLLISLCVYITSPLYV
jgi:hypothetical protein